MVLKTGLSVHHHSGSFGDLNCPTVASPCCLSTCSTQELTLLSNEDAYVTDSPLPCGVVKFLVPLFLNFYFWYLIFYFLLHYCIFLIFIESVLFSTFCLESLDFIFLCNLFFYYFNFTLIFKISYLSLNLGRIYYFYF